MNIDATQNKKAPLATEIMKDVNHGLPPSGEQINAVLEKPIANLEQHKNSPSVDAETKKASEHVQNVLYTTKKMLVDNHIQDLLRQLVDESTQFSNDAKPVLQELNEKVRNSNNEQLKREFAYLQQNGGDIGRGFRSLLRSFITDSDFRRAGFDLIDRISAMFQLEESHRDQSNYQPDIDFLDVTDYNYEGNPHQSTRPEEPQTDPNAVQTTSPVSVDQSQTAGGHQPSPIKTKQVSDKEIDELGEVIDTILQKTGQDQSLGQALNSLVSIYQHLQHQYYEKTHHTDSGPKDATYEKFEQLRENPHLKASQRHLRSLLEHFAGGKSLKGLILAIKDFIRLTANDEKIRQLQNRLEQTFDEVHNSSNVQGTQFRQKFTEIIKEARQVLQGDTKYYYATNRLFREAGEFFRAIKRDPVNRQVAEAWRNITDDLFEDPQHTKISKKGLQAFENVFKHLLLTEFQYVPLPRIEFSNQDMSAILDDLVITSSEILPDKVVFRASTTSQLATHEDNRSENLLEVYLEQVRFRMEDFYFWFNRKTFPSMTDEGRAELAVLDQGVKMHLILRLHISQKEGTEGGKGVLHLDVRKADITIDNLRLRVLEAKRHQMLLRMATPFVKGTIRTRMQQGLESSIRGLVERVNMYLASRNTEQMTGMMQQYLA